MPDSTDELRNVSLGPGQLAFGTTPVRFHTLLGSCVAITLWHPTRKIGGMCHFLLPYRRGNSRLSYGHFADDAIGFFLDTIRGLKTTASEYEVKVLGGGNMMPELGRRDSAVNVSRDNILAARTLLPANGFRIHREDVGGYQHRKIYFEISNGGVWVQYGQQSGPTLE